VDNLSTINSYSNKLRLTGLATGLDTDTIISNMMAAEKIPLNKIYQKRQLAEWKRDDYREITSTLSNFKSEFLDVISSTNMLSGDMYKKYSMTVTNEDGNNSNVVSISAGEEASAEPHTIIVNNLATAEQLKSSSTITSSVEAISSANWSSALGKEFSLNIDGTSKTISLDSLVVDGTEVDQLESIIDTAFGSDKISISEDASGFLKFDVVDGSGVNKITLSSGTDNALTYLGFGSGANLSNRINASSSLETISDKLGTSLTFDEDDNINLNINGEEFSFSKTTSLNSVMSQINGNSSANVSMKYDELKDKIVITSKQTGEGSNIEISETDSNFLSAFDLNTTVAGEDAEVVLDGESIVRSDNNFKVDGVTYTLLNEAPGETQNISLTLDVDKIYDNIKNFIDKYNEVIDKLNTKLNEEYDSSYPPLTDDQKESLSDDEIEKWETQAKIGLLRNDSVLESIVDNMRRAIYEPIDGISSSLSEIGISSGSYTEKGKLNIDESTLKEAIRNNADDVMNLFSQESTSHPGTTTARKLTPDEMSTRYEESGIAYRLYDIIETNISIVSDKNGYKGILLQKAGLAGDSSEYTNILYKQIANYNLQIEDLLEELEDKEESYYSKYASLETAISKMNSQGDWLASQLGI
jgi:flagellar hook-associated protein 2